MRHVLKAIIAACIMAAPATQARADPAQAVLGPQLLSTAMAERSARSDHVENDRYMVVIDFQRASHERRFFLVDLEADTAEAFLMAHGRGSDPDFDGIADTFSNVVGSKMSSLGAFVTGETYYGGHGLSLRMHGLEARNDKAEERLIVIHGASYVAPGRAVLGRSWGCPALEQAVAERVIPLIKNGAFVYAVGPET